MSVARHWTRRLPYSNPDRTDQTNEPDADETIEVTSQSTSQVTRNPQEPIEIVRMAPQVGFGTAGAECERGDALPDGQREVPTSRSRGWLTALDDFRNWLIESK